MLRFVADHARAWVVLALAGAAIVAAQRLGFFQWALDSVASFGPLAPLVFVGLHALTVVAFVPSIVPNFAAGALFGLLAGLPLSLVGAGVGAVCALWLGRTFARETVTARFGRDPRFMALDRLARERGARVVALARLSPVVPFSLANYAFGATPIPARDYLWASVLGTLPSNAVYVYLGALAGELSAWQAEGRERSPFEWALLALGLVATVALTLYLRRHLAGSLDAAAPSDEGPAGGDP